MLTHPITPMRRAASAGMIIVLLLSSLLTACQGAPAPAAQPSAVAAAPTSTSAPPSATPEPAATATPTPQPTATPTAETQQGGEIVEGFRVYEATSGKTTVHVLIQADYVKPADAGHKPYFDTLSSVAGVQGLADRVQAIRAMAEADGYWRGGEGQTDITIRLVKDVVIDRTGQFGELDFTGGSVVAVYETQLNDGRQVTVDLDLDSDKGDIDRAGLDLPTAIFGRGNSRDPSLMIDLVSPLDDGKAENYKKAFDQLRSWLTQQ